MAILSADSIHLSRGDREILTGLSLDFEPGSRAVIRGENGSGKTTLLRAILGLLPVSAGALSFRGEIVGSRSWRGIRSKAAWVPQDGVLHRFPVAAEEVVAIGLSGTRIGQRELKDRIRTAMSAAGASHLEGRCFHRLSGGERRRVSIARCLAQGAELLLLDEPTAALDRDSRGRLLDLVENLDGVAVLAVTHEDNLYSADNWTHLKLEEGRLC